MGAPANALRVAVLSTFTAAFLEPFLRVELARLGLPPELFVGGYGEMESLVLDPSSRLHRFAPDVVVLAIRPEDMAPDAIYRVSTTTGEEYEGQLSAWLERLAGLLSPNGVRPRWLSLVANASVPEPVLGIGDAALAESRTALTAAANSRLQALTARMGGAYVWDYAGLVRSRGSEGWRDDRLWFLGRIPVAAPHHGAMAQHLARTVRAATQPRAKVLVLDLDNTLWGGVLGDDGVEGIKVGDDYPGNLYRQVQRQARTLRDRGILLTIASKNDLEPVQDAFARHPEFLLRWEDFAAHAVSWGPKSQGIAEMAQTLGLGLDAFVFLDDNPVERAEVAASLPEVRIIDVEPWGSLHRALAQCPWFDQVSSSAEDLQRAAQYAVERQREALAASHGSLDEFLVSLDLTATISPTSTVERGRVAQLLAKTNQFNLTLRRHSEAQVAAFLETPDRSHVVHMRLADRFGDHGIIAAAVLLRDGEQAIIDSFVMSCRVMNRYAEHALLAYLGEVARSWGGRTLVGEYVSGPRNGMVAGFYASNGFSSVGEHRWELALDVGVPEWPSPVRRA
jgi:FkbH-like protein